MSEAAKTTGQLSNTQAQQQPAATMENSTSISTGDCIYTPQSPAVEALNDGEVGIDVFRIDVSDGTESASMDLSVNITGADENPIPTPNPSLAQSRLRLQTLNQLQLRPQALNQLLSMHFCWKQSRMTA